MNCGPMYKNTLAYKFYLHF